MKHEASDERSGTQGENPRKRQKKPLGPLSPSAQLPKASVNSLDDALDPQLLTPKVWIKLFEYFQLHFATDLPFIHAPRFLAPLQQIDRQHSSAVRPPYSAPFLLAFLTLTASCHEMVEKYHSWRSTGLRKQGTASHYYYEMARSHLKGHDDNITLERVQAQLMLGYYEWSICKGRAAWLIIGDAIRSAQVLNLHIDDPKEANKHTLDPFQKDASPDTIELSDVTSTAERFIDREISRRTFWSCFILDRYLSGGKGRPSNISVEDISIQLPCSETAFRNGREVKTPFLGEESQDVSRRMEEEHASKHGMESLRANGTETTSAHSDHARPDSSEAVRWEIGRDQSALCHYIKAMDLFKAIFKWSLLGGRRVDKKTPPWDPLSSLQKYQNRLRALGNDIPSDLKLNSYNTSGHITSKTSTTYTLLHSLRLLCFIMLHREYIPFLALNCKKPEGPLDEPTFPEEEKNGFWDTSARTCFESAKDLTDLLCACQQWEALPETPLTLFMEFQVAICGVYCLHFPWMDPGGYITKQTASRGFALLRQHKGRMLIGSGWWDMILALDAYYRKVRNERSKNKNASESSRTSADPKKISVSEGGTGGGLEEWIADWENRLKTFGDNTVDHDGDVGMLDTDGDVKGPDDASDSGSVTKNELTDTIESNRSIEATPEALSRQGSKEGVRSLGWATVNRTNGAKPEPPNPHLHSTLNAPHPGYNSEYGPHSSNAPPYFQPQAYPALSAERQSLYHQQQVQSYTTQGAVIPPGPHHGAQWPSPISQSRVPNWVDNVNNSFDGGDFVCFSAGAPPQTFAQFTDSSAWIAQASQAYHGQAT